MNEINKAYNPKETEGKIYELWEKSGYFAPEAHRPRADSPDKSSGGKPYVILLPPPNITGSLHLGHALNATISDILIRYHRMRGFKTVWLPGIDHAGIATQNVVEKELKKEGKSRFDLGRGKFVERVWQWKEKYGNIILEQLKKLGASCDWSRTRFTLDPDYSLDVQKAFVHYHKKGFIYRGERVINWCPRCQTGLSDLEIEYEEEKTKLWHIRYPIKISEGNEMGRKDEKDKEDEPARHASQLAGDAGGRNEKDDGRYIVVATTRPETMLGDAAVAVNPKDKRYKKLVGREVNLPIQNRPIPVVADEGVDAGFGTGAVKVTPAHDLLDAEIAERHNLPFYQVINEKGKMTDEAGIICRGLKISDCRAKVVEELQKHNLIEKIEDYTHNVARCYRCPSVLEPILSNQWFVKMGAFAEMAEEAVRSKKIEIIPKNFEKPYFAWLENIKDWCVSRQIWWGHRLPAFFCRKKQEEITNNKSGEDFIVALEKPATCPFCKNCDMEQSADVLDTWFSSALWPFGGLKEKDRKRFYPSSVLITARDIINLWVARMIFSGLEFMKETPFGDVLIHGTILTKEGKRMSKSLGTGVDPLFLIDNYGADALRFGLVWQAMGNQDIRWDEAAVVAGKKFANKIWNASRFVLGQIGNSNLRMPDYKQYPKPKTKADKKILNELAETKKKIEKDIEAYNFGRALHEIYDFFWHRFCDVYLEEAKKQGAATTDPVLLFVLSESLKMIHPFMPFVSEEIYRRFGLRGKKDFLMIENW